MTEMNTLELLLQETRKSNRRRLWTIVLLGLILAALVTCAIILVPRAIETMNNLNAMSASYGATAQKAELFFNSFSEEQLQGMSDSLPKLSEFIQTVSGWFE